MNEILLLVGIAFAILLLLFLVLKLKIHAFISLLIVSIVVGIVTGMDFSGIIKSMQDGMGNTLGFVATDRCSKHRVEQSRSLNIC